LLEVKPSPPSAMVGAGEFLVVSSAFFPPDVELGRPELWEFSVDDGAFETVFVAAREADVWLGAWESVEGEGLLFEVVTATFPS